MLDWYSGLNNMLLSSFDKTIHTCKIVRIVLVDILSVVSLNDL